MQVALPSGLKPQQFTTTLIGEAYLPQISVTKPRPTLVCELSPPPLTLLFTPTLVGDCREESLVFENTGIISCTVRMNTLIQFFIRKLCNLTVYISLSEASKKELNPPPGNQSLFSVMAGPFCPLCNGILSNS